MYTALSGLLLALLLWYFFFFKQKTAYELRISDWSSDVCSSDLWILRTVIISMKPAFGSTKKRAYERLLGTVLGGLAGVGVLLVVKDTAEIGRASCRERVCQYV